MKRPWCTPRPRAFGGEWHWWSPWHEELRLMLPEEPRYPTAREQRGGQDRTRNAEDRRKRRRDGGGGTTNDGGQNDGT